MGVVLRPDDIQPGIFVTPMNRGRFHEKVCMVVEVDYPFAVIIHGVGCDIYAKSMIDLRDFNLKRMSNEFVRGMGMDPDQIRKLHNVTVCCA